MPQTLTEEQKDTSSGSLILYETRSEEVQEIIGRMPHWLVRWGVTVGICILAIIFTGAYFVRYPDTVKINATVATTQLPMRVEAGSTGHIEKLFVEDNSIVQKGQMIALLESDAGYEEVMSIKMLAEAIDTSTTVQGIVRNMEFKRFSNLGYLQPVYADLQNTVKEHLSDNRLDYDEEKEIRELARNMLAQIEHWEHANVIYSPGDGVLRYYYKWATGQQVREHEAMMSVLSRSNTVIVKGSVPVDVARKIKTGQKATVKLYEFPAQEYGVLNTEVSYISPVSMDSLFNVELQLKNGLITTSGKEISVQGMHMAQADIFLNEKSVLRRVLDKITTTR